MIGQPWTDILSATLVACNIGLTHRWITFMQFQGAVIVLLLAAGWLWSGVVRLRELRRVQAAARSRLLRAAAAGSNVPSVPTQCCASGALVLPPSLQTSAAPARHTDSLSRRGSNGSLAAQQQSLSGCGGGGVSCHPAAAATDGRDQYSVRWPAVSVVLPVKGQRAHSSEAWASQLAMRYDGPLEFLFVADDAADPARAALRTLFAEHEGVDARIVVAPHARQTSQKIRNILAGIEAASKAAEYILCLDDDIVLHPGALAELVAGLAADDSCFMATGYPFDVPPPGAGMLTHCMLAYHLPLLIAFSIRQRTSFVWGGCMLFPAEALRSGTHGILQAWAEGGYSDDLIVAAKCGEAGLRILCPSSAVFRQTLVADPPFATYWNYLRRQLFVMDTYASAHNRRLNHTMLALHAYLSWAIVLPLLTACARLAVWGAQVALLPTQKIYGGPGTSWDWLARFGGTAAAASTTSTGSVVVTSTAGSSSALAAASVAAGLLAFAAAALALRWMTGVVLALLAALNPEDPSPARLSAFCWTKVWAGFVANNALLPLCATYTFLTPSVIWSGTRYWKRHGRVVQVQRLRTPKEV